MHILGARIAKNIAEITVELNNLTIKINDLQGKSLQKNAKLLPKIANRFMLESAVKLPYAFMGFAGWQTCKLIDSSFDLLAMKRMKKERDLQNK